ncbi:MULTISPECIES: hypothetical protein [unclassified Pseudoclavibacter]|uniref:hypothetical protein n=1 Tax=unclassified Pseudoclavibacter TaxID=2615177 RepID=UPI001BA87757|nr:hypothetical protein [Pseudoclavibacter sp. Marseille-Q4354]MBS3177913.1 hypothetical protein [Pseudoclavibacter sp. Marseille-Q4354]
MTYPNHSPHATFSGALGVSGGGGYVPATAEIGDGWMTLWALAPEGWTVVVRAPASQVTVTSRAQSIHLAVGGVKYPLLADPGAVNRALGYTTAGAVAAVLDRPMAGAAADVGALRNQISAASSWSAGGGPQFLDAARQSGARVSRLGYGAIAAIGCGTGIAVVVVVTVLTVFAVNF